MAEVAAEDVTQSHPKSSLPAAAEPAAKHKAPGRSASLQSFLIVVTATASVAFSLACAIWCCFRILHFPVTPEGPLVLLPFLPQETIPGLFLSPIASNAEPNDSLIKSLVLGFAVIALTTIAFLVFHVRAYARSLKDGRTIHSHIWRLLVFFHTRWGAVCLGFLPALLFFVAMILDGEHDAAVFAMALAAIYVAAEHYTSLEEQKENLRDQVGVMEDLSHQLDSNVKSIVSALGKSNAVVEMYREYGTTARERTENDARARSSKQPSLPAQMELTDDDRHIRAIFRECAIDRDWWDQDWATYCSPANEVANEPRTFFNALVKGNRTDVTIVVPYSFRGRPGAYSPFSNLIGLIWHCVVLAKAAEHFTGKQASPENPDMVATDRTSAVPTDVQLSLHKNGQDASLTGQRAAGHASGVAGPELPRLRLMMAETSLWVHVVDRYVHQIVDQPNDELLVRNLSLNVGQRLKPLARWAIGEIDQIAVHGPTAEEYICSRLCAAQPNLFQPNDVDKAFFESVLKSDDLHFNDWLDLWEAGERQVRTDKCAELLFDFAKLLHARHGRPVAGGSCSATCFPCELQ
ncbi:hypothetical protein [Paraburkholderia fungorum]|uniref:hypothetical protein n=1 Tax=Paraburkholderia fungorum TaxID=134537 RepID=UPI0038B89331